MSSTPRVFLTPELLTGDATVLPEDVAHHLRNVLRMRPGEAVTLLDGVGNETPGELVEVTRERVTVRVGPSVPCATEPPYRAIVCQALPKTPEKIEQVLQHGTELGAAGFIVFASERSVARLDDARAASKLERWRRIVQGAAEQSARGRIPTVAWSGRGLWGLDDARVIVLHESAEATLHDALADTPSNAIIALVVGPEGGLTENEVARWVAGGAISVRLGPRVLRTETAALTALAQLAYHFER